MQTEGGGGVCAKELLPFARLFIIAYEYIRTASLPSIHFVYFIHESITETVGYGVVAAAAFTFVSHPTNTHLIVEWNFSYKMLFPLATILIVALILHSNVYRLYYIEVRWYCSIKRGKKKKTMKKTRQRKEESSFLKLNVSLVGAKNIMYTRMVNEPFRVLFFARALSRTARGYFSTEIKPKNFVKSEENKSIMCRFSMAAAIFPCENWGAIFWTLGAAAIAASLLKMKSRNLPRSVFAVLASPVAKKSTNSPGRKVNTFLPTSLKNYNIARLVSLFYAAIQLFQL